MPRDVERLERRKPRVGVDTAEGIGSDSGKQRVITEKDGCDFGPGVSGDTVSASFQFGCRQNPDFLLRQVQGRIVPDDHAVVYVHNACLRNAHLTLIRYLRLYLCVEVEVVTENARSGGLDRICAAVRGAGRCSPSTIRIVGPESWSSTITRRGRWRKFRSLVGGPEMDAL